MRESAQALRAYQDYQAQTPPRSLDRLADRYQSASDAHPPTRRLQTLKDWSRLHGWQERIAAYERQLIEERDAQDAEERKRARKQRLQVARGVRTKSVEALTVLTAQDLARRPSAIVRLLEYADTTERKDMGEPDQRVEVGGPDGGHIQFTFHIDRANQPDD